MSKIYRGGIVNSVGKNIVGDSKINTMAGLLDVINGLPLAIAVIDKDRKVILANKAIHLFVNKKETELVGKLGGEAFECIHHEDMPQGCGFGEECIKCRLRLAILAAIEKKQPQYMVETTMVFKNHGQMNLRISTQPLVMDGENVVLFAIEDITAAKKNEQTVIQKEKLSAAIQTAGAVCHEMNQPLMVILGLSDLLLEMLDEKDQNRSNMEEIKNQALKLGGISKKLMSITHFKTKDYLSDKILDIDAASMGRNINDDTDKER